jgi:hypothetical protein
MTFKEILLTTFFILTVLSALGSTTISADETRPGLTDARVIRLILCIIATTTFCMFVD